MTTSLANRTLLVSRSLEVTEHGQTPEGAFLACTEFPTYRYSWFRDGAFIAKAMDDWGRHDSAAAFHSWAVGVIRKQSAVIEGVEAGRVSAERILHTRYLPDGNPGEESWPNFQLDGIGTWLWSFGEHLTRTGREAAGQERESARLAADYLVALWAVPNFDCWEEHEDMVHPATLGAIQAGLRAAADILEDRRYSGAAEAVRSFLLASSARVGHFGKHLGTDEVDANLLWLSYPYQVVEASHPVMVRTVRLIRERLLDPDGGVHRYANDSYYGGGSWPLLTAALAHWHIDQGETAEAERLLSWIEAQADARGDLPEQSSRHLNAPAKLHDWEQLWGKSACPLLWSHAAYLTLLHRLQGRENEK